MSKTPLSHSVIFLHFLRTPQCCNSSLTPPGTISHTYTKKPNPKHTLLRLSKGFSQPVAVLLSSAAESQNLVKRGLASTAVQVLSAFQARQRFSYFFSLQASLFTENPGLPPTCLFSQAGSSSVCYVLLLRSSTSISHGSLLYKKRRKTK